MSGSKSAYFSVLLNGCSFKCCSKIKKYSHKILHPEQASHAQVEKTFRIKIDLLKAAVNGFMCQLYNAVIKLIPFYLLVSGFMNFLGLR